MEWLWNLMADHESVAYTVIVYSVVIAIGVALGKVKFFGISFGIAWVLFAGIAMAEMGFTVNTHIQHFIKEFGLILFVYTIGLQVGPGFFSAFKKEGIKLNLLAVISIATCVATVIAIHYLTNTDMSTLVGIMSGAVTNTPGLGAANAALAEKFGEDAPSLTTMYAVAYPFGVFGIIIVMLGLRGIFKVNIEAEKRLNSLRHSKDQVVINRFAIKVSNPSLFGKKLSVIKKTLDFDFTISRMCRKGEILLADADTLIEEGDVVLVVANQRENEKFFTLMGDSVAITDYFPDEKDMRYTSRRINVTQRAIFTKTLGELDVRRRFGVTITRVFRAGVEFVPSAHTKLQFGDTITVIGDETHIQLVSKEFGNSKRRLQTPHIAELFMGITLGVLLGSIPFSIPGIPGAVRLGLAGGPLIVAILISRYGGKFSVTHYVSQSANLMVREIGIVLFLASVGLDAKAKFIETLLHGDGLYWMGLGVLITLIPLLVTSLIARIKGKLDYLEICGLLSGASTDPPALAFANDMSNSEIPALTYASVYPLTTFLRIMVAQLLIVFFV
ncbi:MULTISPECIES: putative transporter [Capnocytophaga]|uniref:putative transporter n=1 Tax=Capnocytophaga TaxID=1016 RepID=UPI00020C73E6|nr:MULTISPECIES: putative transporter [Capnocytophaga]KHE68353.1 TrkA protein [Capnocytophaga sp. oral taxon 329 str. F0087]QGS18181.1 putative transporter [Capnocytophaga sp. FDAARGOS_737]